MSENAPALWAQVAPLLREPPPGLPYPPPTRSGGFKIGGWPGGVVALILFNVIRMCGALDSPRTPTVDYADYSPPAPRQGVPAQADTAKTLLDPAERQTLAWGLLQHSLQIGDCQTVREQWRNYLGLAVSATANQDVEAARKRQVLAMCPELRELLEEPP